MRSGRLPISLRSSLWLTGGMLVGGLLIWVALLVTFRLKTARKEYRSDRRAISAIERSGGEVKTCLFRPDWIPSLVGDKHLSVYDRAWQVKLDVGYYVVVDESPLAILQDLRNLQDLSLSVDHISDEVMERLGGLPRLRSLFLKIRLCDDSDVLWLSELRNIEDISLCFYKTDLSDEGWHQLQGIENLRGLEFENRWLTDDAVLARLQGFTQLERLLLDSTDVTDDGLRYLNGLTNLKELSLVFTRIGDAGLAHLSGLNRLERLRLGATNVTDEGLKHVSSLSELRYLHLTSTRIGDPGMKHIAGLAHLQELWIRDTNVSYSALTKLQQKLPHCEIMQ